MMNPSYLELSYSALIYTNKEAKKEALKNSEMRWTSAYPQLAKHYDEQYQKIPAECDLYCTSGKTPWRIFVVGVRDQFQDGIF